VGLDSTALLVEFVNRTEAGDPDCRPDAILFADTGGEKSWTLDFLPTMNRYLEAHSFPAVTVVRYRVKDFQRRYKNVPIGGWYPPYSSLEENCLSNGTLPSIAFGFQRRSCSQKWKQTPQNEWMKAFPLALSAWTRGERVVKAIGFDASPQDKKRCTYGEDHNKDQKKYEYWYPLVEWSYDRAKCAEIVRAAGLAAPGFEHAEEPVPKSACFFCPASQPEEILALPKPYLRRIVVMEARAKPRLLKIEGLWCKTSKKRPGSMTQFIIDKGLLPPEEVERLQKEVPQELMDRYAAHNRGEPIISWEQFFQRLNVEDVEDGPAPTEAFYGSVEETDAKDGA